MDLTQIPEPALRAELQRRAEERRLAEEARLEARRQVGLRHIDALIELTPEHDRSSCSDEHPTNEGRCSRCTFMHIKSRQYWDSDFELNVSISLAPGVEY
jgi:hypothetical protein